MDKLEIKKQSLDFLICCYFGQSHDLIKAAIDRAYIDMASHTLKWPENAPKDSKWECRYKGTIRIIEHEQNAFVTDRKGDGDFSLSKQRFAEAVSKDRKGFNNFDFSEFNLIFDVIRKILATDR